MRNSVRRRPGLLGQVVGHLEVNVVGRKGFPRAQLSSMIADQVVGNVEAPAVVPAILEPAGQLVAGVVVENIDIQLPLVRQAGKRQVAAADKADSGVHLVGAEEQIEFGVNG